MMMPEQQKPENFGDLKNMILVRKKDPGVIQAKPYAPSLPVALVVILNFISSFAYF
jgi:hypothetical protein